MVNGGVLGALSNAVLKTMGTRGCSLLALLFLSSTRLHPPTRESPSFSLELPFSIFHSANQGSCIICRAMSIIAGSFGVQIFARALEDRGFGRESPLDRLRGC